MQRIAIVYEPFSPVQKVTIYNIQSDLDLLLFQFKVNDSETLIK